MPVYPADREQSPSRIDNLFTPVRITPLTSVLAGVQSATRLVKARPFDRPRSVNHHLRQGRSGLAFFLRLCSSSRVFGSSLGCRGVIKTVALRARVVRRRSVQEVVTEDLQIEALRAHLAARIGAQRYELWFGPHTQLCVAAGRLNIRVVSSFVRDWLRQHFADDVRACCREVMGQDLFVEFEVDKSTPSGETSSFSPPRKPAQVDSPPKKPLQGPHATVEPCSLAAEPSSADAAAVASADRSSPRGHGQNHESGFGDFVVGPSNEYAFRSAQLITANGTHKPSPVLFHGPTGVGKTHLLRSIRVEHLRRHRRARAVYLTAEQFTTSFVEALRGSGLPSFRQKCRGADLLLIDDLQFFAGKRATLEELQHTIDALLADGRQLVLAGDRGLAELSARGGLGPELISRLAGGLVCEIQPPEFATRLDILRRLCAEMKMDIADELLSMVATQITLGARELRGALHRLQATSLAWNQPISREMAQRALTDLAQQGTRSVRLADVEHAICNVFGVEPAQLRSDRKVRSVSEPRMLAMWLARKYTRAPWSEIGEYFGRRSHSTVISAHHRVEQLIGRQAEVEVSNRHCPVEEAIRRVEAALRTA
jgi:chromosomal replication initiator protein